MREKKVDDERHVSQREKRKRERARERDRTSKEKRINAKLDEAKEKNEK